MAITNIFTEPGVYSRFQPTTILPSIPGGIRVAALIGTGRLTNLLKGEVVTRGVSADGTDALAHTAVVLDSTTIVDEDYVTYTLGVDYQLTGGAIDWSLNGQAALVGTSNFTSPVIPAATLVGKTFKATINGGTEQTYTFVSGDFAGVNATSIEVATALQTNISNILVSGTSTPNHVAVKTTVTNNGTLLIGTGTSNTILGFIEGSYVVGPKEPVTGKAYYVDYEYAKAVGDATSSYTPKFYFDMQSVMSDLGNVGSVDATQPNSMGNIVTLPVAAELVFQQGASAVCLVQVNPADGGALNQFRIALNKLLNTSGVNIVVPLLANSSLFSDVKTHVNTASSITERKERTAILGLSGSPSILTLIGYATALADKRIMLVYPTSGVRTISNLGAVTLDGTFLAAAIAGLRTSTAFDVAEPLTRKSPAGFDSIPDTLLRAQKNQLSSNGICVVEDFNSVPRVRFGTTTDPSSVDNREFSVVETVDYVASSLRRLLEAIFIGQKILPETPSQIRSTVGAALSSLQSIQIINGFQNIQASIDNGDPTQINVSFQVSATYPLNYILITFGLEL